MTVAEIEEEFRDEMSRAGGGSWLQTAGPSPAIPVDKGATVTLSELLSLDDDELIFQSYRLVLGREPDQAGLGHYRQALQSGSCTKVELLAALRYSAEGKRIKRSIRGLLPRFAIHRTYRLPIVGGLLWISTGASRMRRLVQQLAHNERTQHRSLTELTRKVDAARVELRDCVDRLTTRIDRLSTGVSKISDCLGPIEEAHRVEPLLLRMTKLSDRLGAIEDEPWTEPLVLLAERLADMETQLTELGICSDNVAALGAAIDAAKREEGWDEVGEALAVRFLQALRTQDGRVRRAEAMVQENRVELQNQQRRLGLILEDVRKRMGQAFSKQELDQLEEEHDHLLDPLYVAFEDRFRGSREDIRQRQRAYLPIVTEADAGTQDRPIVDLGAGRGEWLELLRDERLTARGVDINQSMVEVCRERGLECVQQDALSYLAGLPSDSLGAVTGFHLIEHLPFRTMVALFDESLRTLKSGGLIVFETPNPANLIVASRWFYLDPSHRNPLPGEMVAMIAEARGFVRVSIHELHPMPQSFEAKDTLLAQQLDRLFHGPQDYALIARKA